MASPIQKCDVCSEKTHEIKHTLVSPNSRMLVCSDFCLDILKNLEQELKDFDLDEKRDGVERPSIKAILLREVQKLMLPPSALRKVDA